MRTCKSLSTITSYLRHSTRCMQCIKYWGDEIHNLKWDWSGVCPQDKTQHFYEVYFVIYVACFIYYSKYPWSIMFLTINGKSGHLNVILKDWVKYSNKQCSLQWFIFSHYWLCLPLLRIFLYYNTGQSNKNNFI